MKKVFIADTEKHVLMALILVLEEHGEFSITGNARSAESLLAKVCKQPSDLILLDWNLPGLHPQRLIRTLRECCPGTKLVATSVKPEHEKETKEHGLDGFISKQLSAELFILSLMHILSEKNH